MDTSHHYLGVTSQDSQRHRWPDGYVGDNKYENNSIMATLHPFMANICVASSSRKFKHQYDTLLTLRVPHTLAMPNRALDSGYPDGTR